MLNLFYPSKSNLVSVGVALVTSVKLLTPAQAFISEDIDKPNNEYYPNISSFDTFDSQFADSININPEQLLVENHQKTLLEDSRNLIDKIDDAQVKTEMLINLAQQYYELNELEITQETLREALEVSKDVEENSSKTLLMIKIATKFIEIEKIQDLETASEILDLALESSQDISENSTKAAVLMDLASKYEQIGNSEKADIILTEVETIVAEIENPPPSFPFKPLPLSGQINFGTNLSFAKNSLANFTVGGRFNKRWETDEMNLYFRFLNSYDDSRDSGDENRILFDIVTQYKHYFSERTYYFGNLAYLQDDFSGTDGRFSYFTGFGFNLWRGATQDETLDMQLGIGDLFQNSDIKNKNAPFPVFQYALIYRDLFFTDWKFEQIFALEVPVRNTANYFADSRTIVTIPTINNWSVFTSLNLRYFGIPEFDEPNLSAKFIGGIRYDF